MYIIVPLPKNMLHFLYVASRFHLTLVEVLFFLKVYKLGFF